MEAMELHCFKIISSVGEAKSAFIEAIRNARKGNLIQATALFEAGERKLIEGHKVHAALLQNEAAGQKIELSLLLVHSEDQLMNAETSKLQAEEFLYLYRYLNEGGLLYES